MEREKNRVGCCTLVIAISGWLILGAAITYLEFKRNAEINPLAGTVNYLLKEVENLRAEMETLKNNTNTRIDLLERRNDGPMTMGDADDYYDDFDEDYDGEPVEEEGAGKEPPRPAAAAGTSTGRRRRRSSKTSAADKLRGKRNIAPLPLLGSSPNAIVRQAWAKPGNITRDSIEAEIIVNTHRALEPPPHEIWNPQQPSTACCKPIVAHFEGDISTARNFKTSHHQGNHRVYQNGVISEWEPAKWMRELGLTSSFDLDSGRSEVSIKEESQGLYFVYAQVFYADPHDIAGFGIYVNHENVFQCTVTSLHQAETHRQRNKSNSCYTGGMVRLMAGDKITLREIEGTRSTVMHAPKSFLGMFRVHTS